jgi:DNA-binding PadR family transcriptional regulator
LAISYEIERIINRRASVGSLYKTLHRMERAGFVVSEWASEGDRHQGPRRRYYETTAEGAAALAAHWSELRRIRRLSASESPR